MSRTYRRQRFTDKQRALLKREHPAFFDADGWAAANH